MVEKSKKEVILQVLDPDPTHVGRNIVTLDRETKTTLEITSGDIVEIEGTKKTAAIVWPARTEDEGRKIIRMDSFIRHNAGVGLNERVKVRKVIPTEAKKVVLAPIEEVRIIASGYERILKKSFLGRPLTLGDNVWVSVFGSGFIYRVVDSQPRGIVKVTGITQFQLKEKPVKDALEGVPSVAYEDIGGLDEQVQKVREMVELPMKHPELFQKLGIVPPKGILLYGPPGTGKTLLAKAVANEAQVHFISISAPEVMGKFVGEAEERVRKIFKDAQDNAPSIIFIDEIDSIAPKRDEVNGEVERRVVAQILSLMDGLSARGEVIVMAATNRVNSIDEALRRPGRFDREIEFGVPDKKAREEVLSIHTRGMPLAKRFAVVNGAKATGLKGLEKEIFNIVKSNKNIEKEVITDKYNSAIEKKSDKAELSKISEVTDSLEEKKLLKKEDFELEKFAALTHGFVGADLQALTKEAAMKALRRYLPEIDLEEETIPAEVLEMLKITGDDFMEGLKDVQPSALREVAIEVPNVHWEDIGALDDVKQELKQAVEWPLKKPEAFKKMGIRPPTGVLLYGPPGTGKTLLAKAIATESEANFISVKGPEVLSMWVGESLPYDEELLVFDGKKIFREKIGKIVENKMKLQVVTFDDDGKVFFSKINDFIKHELNGKLVEIKTKTGRRIRVTDKHSLFSLINNEIEEVSPKELIPKKSVLAIPAKMPNISFENSMNIIDYFDSTAMVHSDEIFKFIKCLGYKKASAITGISKKYLYDITDKKLPINKGNLLLLEAATKQRFDLGKAQIGIKGARNRMPAIIKNIDDLFEIIGLWVAEGDFNAGVPRLSIYNEYVYVRFCELAQNLGLKYSRFEGNVVINSETFATLLKNMGLNSGAFAKSVPAELFIRNNKCVYGFLRGYFSGDGTIKNNGHSCLIEASTVSKKLANDLLYLLLKLGIVATCKEKEEHSGNISYRIQLFGIENLKKFSSAGFIDSKRNNILKTYINRVSWSRSNTVPVNPKIKEVLNEAFCGYPNNKSVGTKKLREALCLVDAQKSNKELWKLVESDVYWDRVEDISVVSDEKFVYDISVNPCQNFVAGFGGLFAHNSEKGIRKIFRKARQVSPCIVFFDEIDAIASKRGNELGNNVTERIVNQMLTEIDGVETMKNVVFIAATNRPDLIDTGLLRPGRIDKLVKVSAPDEKAREAILKVHTKNVNIDDSVSLKELAEKTKGFSGADLEGLVREAALQLLQDSKMKPSPIKMEHFDIILKKVKPTIDEETEKAYDEYAENALDFRPNYVG